MSHGSAQKRRALLFCTKCKVLLFCAKHKALLSCTECMTLFVLRKSAKFYYFYFGIEGFCVKDFMKGSNEL